MRLKIFLLLNSLQKEFENFFTVNFIEKKKSKFFYSQFYWKKFRKFLIVNFRLLKNFLLLNSLQKKFENFLQSISLKKIFENFSENPKKNFLPKKKKNGHRGGKCSFFSSKIRHHLSLDFDVIYLMIFFDKLFCAFYSQKSEAYLSAAAVKIVSVLFFFLPPWHFFCSDDWFFILHCY